MTRPRPALLVLGRTIRVGDAETEIVRRAGTDDRPIVRVALAGDREAVEALRGTDLFGRREDAPPLGDDEYWAEELEGLAVRDGDAAVGEVVGLMGLPSCDVLDVRRADGSQLLVPMVRDAIRAIDVQGGVVDIDLGFLGE